MNRWRLLAAVILSSLLAAACSTTPAPASIPGLEATLAVQTLTAQQGNVLPFRPTPTPTQAPLFAPPTALASAAQAAAPLALEPVAPTPNKVNDKVKALTSNCENAVEFVTDVTVPDDTKLKSKSTFVKTWRFKNSGTCTWNKDYRVVYVAGELVGLVQIMPLSREVNPGDTVDVSVPFTCPDMDGTYKSKWMFLDDLGNYFGTGDGSQNAFWVSIEVVGSQNGNYGNCGGGG